MNKIYKVVIIIMKKKRTIINNLKKKKADAQRKAKRRGNIKFNKINRGEITVRAALRVNLMVC